MNTERGDVSINSLFANLSSLGGHESDYAQLRVGLSVIELLLLGYLLVILLVLLFILKLGEVGWKALVCLLWLHHVLVA